VEWCEVEVYDGKGGGNGGSGLRNWEESRKDLKWKDGTGVRWQ